MEREEKPMIDQKYIDMVERFKQIPNNRVTSNTVKRMKMINQFRIWYFIHKDELTRDERNYLQDNIYMYESEDEVESSPHPDKEWWA